LGVAEELEGGTATDAAIWRTSGTAASASALRAGVEVEREMGPMGGSVYGYPVRLVRSMRKKTSLHHAMRREGSWDGMRIWARADWRRAREGSVAVSAGAGGGAGAGAGAGACAGAASGG
jgi:hypothetical protein